MPRQVKRLADANSLAQLFVRAAECVKQDFADAVGEVGLSAPLARAVRFLQRPAPMRDLAEHLECDRSYITSLADQLEKRGLVERVQGEDRRIKLLALTAQGEAIRVRISADVAERNRLLNRLTDEERAALRLILDKVAAEPR